MNEILKEKWKDIYIWGENNQVKKVDTIEEALEQGKAGYYVVCDEKNNVYGTGITIQETLEDFFFSFLQQGDINNLLKLDLAVAPQFGEDNWNLYPTTHDVIIVCEKERCDSMIKDNEIIPFLFCQNNIVCKNKQGIAHIDWDKTKIH